MRSNRIAIPMTLLMFGLPALTGAVTLNPKGLGQVLIYPYYTINAGHDSYVSVTNASDVGKLVKVSFHEGYNGRRVLDFNLYLSAHDVWTATISAPDGTATSGARMSTSDHSCMDPIPAHPQPFSTAGFDGSSLSADGGPTTPDRTREGYIDMIAAGDIIPGSATDTAITHMQTGDPNQGMPPGCGHLPATLLTDIVTPTSGLLGSGGIIDVGAGTFYAYDAVALTGFTDSVLMTSTSGPGHPSLEDARSSASASPNGAIATVFTDNGATLMLDYARGIDAVSAVLMADALYNEYLVGAGLGANTDWVVTFPTKQFYVDKLLYPSSTTSPFVGPFLAPGESSVFAGVDIYDQEELPRGLVQCAPLRPCFAHSVLLPHEVNVVSFLQEPGGAVSGVFGSPRTFDPVAQQLIANIDPVGDDGWLKLDFTFSLDGVPTSPGLSGGTNPAAPGATANLHGQPVTGFMAYDIINAHALPGRLANYGGVFGHRGSISCVSDVPNGGAGRDPCS